MISMEALYKVSAYSADGDLLNKWEYVDKSAADNIKTTMERGTDRDISCKISEQPLETHAQMLVRLGQMMHTLPAANTVNFPASHPDHLRITLDALVDVDTWAAKIAAAPVTTDTGDNRHRTASAMWRGWWVTLNALESLPAEPARPTQDGHLAGYGPGLPTPARVFDEDGACMTCGRDVSAYTDFFCDEHRTMPAPAAPVAVSPERVVISDSTIAEAERLERLHTHDGRDCYCLTPDAVSEKRAAELCAELNAFPSPAAADAHLRSQPEFHRVLNVTAFDLIFDAELVDGSTITHTARGGWTWER